MMLLRLARVNRAMYSVLLACMLLGYCTCIVAANADTGYELASKTEMQLVSSTLGSKNFQHETLGWITANKSRGELGPTAMIYRGDLGKVFMLNTKTKTYYVTEANAHPKGKKYFSTPKPTGETKKIAGFTASKFTVKPIRGKKESSYAVYLTKDVGKDTQHILNALTDNPILGNELVAFGKEMGLVVRTETTVGEGQGTIVRELVSLTPKEIDPELFEVPLDYTKLSTSAADNDEAHKAH